MRRKYCNYVCYCVCIFFRKFSPIHYVHVMSIDCLIYDSLGKSPSCSLSFVKTRCKDKDKKVGKLLVAIFGRSYYTGVIKLFPKPHQPMHQNSV